MLWFIVILIAYFFLGIASLGDKVFLKGKQQSPAIYTFYVGIMGGLVVFLIPFFGIDISSFQDLLYPALEGILYAAALYSLYLALSRTEVSIAIPIIGALQPIFVFFLTIVFYGFSELAVKDVIALAILILGTFLISLEKGGSKINVKKMAIAIVPAFLFALDMILTKQVFFNFDFWEGLILMRIFTFLTVLFFLFSSKFRKELSARRKDKSKGKGLVFVFAQGAGGLGILLQSYAISLVPTIYLAVLNALKGVQYVFLLFATMLVSYYFPKIIKEDFKRRALIRKIISVIIISAGIALLML